MTDQPRSIGRGRHVNLGEQLVRLKARRQKPLEQGVGIDGAATPHARRHHRTAEDTHDHGRFGRRVRVRHAATQRAAGTDGVVADVAHGRGEHRRGRGNGRRALDGPMPSERTDRQPTVDADASQLGDVVDVDQHRRSGQAQREHGQQALATGQDLRVVAVLGQQLNGLRHGFRSSIVEWR